MTGRRDMRLVLIVALLCIGLVLVAGYGPVPAALSSFVRHWQHVLFAWPVQPGAPVQPAPTPAYPSGIPPVVTAVVTAVVTVVPAPPPAAQELPSSSPTPAPGRRTHVTPWRPPTPRVELLSCVPCAGTRRSRPMPETAKARGIARLYELAGIRRGRPSDLRLAIPPASGMVTALLQ